MWKTTILIVDDHPIMREGLRKLLSLEADLAVVGEAETGEQALLMTQKLQPDVVVLDINLPILNGLQVAARLKPTQTHTAIVLLTAYDDREQMIQAMRAGASSYCPKEIQPDALISIIRQAAQGKYIIGEKIYSEREVQEWLTEQSRSTVGDQSHAEDDGITPLSPREMEILRFVTRGLLNKEIAQELGISHQTVRNHMTSILDKLKVESRTQAAVYALKRGWVRAQDYNNPAEE